MSTAVSSVRQLLLPAISFVDEINARATKLLRPRIQPRFDVNERLTPIQAMITHAAKMEHAGLVSGFISSIYRATMRSVMLLIDISSWCSIAATPSWRCIKPMLSYDEHFNRLFSQLCGLPLGFQVHILQKLLYQLQKLAPGSDEYLKRAFAFTLALLYFDVPRILTNLSTLYQDALFTVDTSLDPHAVMIHWFGSLSELWLDTAFSMWNGAWETYLLCFPAHVQSSANGDMLSAQTFDVGSEVPPAECTEYHHWYQRMCTKWKALRPSFAREFECFHQGISGRLRAAWRISDMLDDKGMSSPQWLLFPTQPQPHWTTAFSQHMERHSPFSLRMPLPKLAWNGVFYMTMDYIKGVTATDLAPLSCGQQLCRLSTGKCSVTFTPVQSARFLTCLINARRRLDIGWNRLVVEPEGAGLYAVAAWPDQHVVPDELYEMHVLLDTHMCIFTTSETWAACLNDMVPRLLKQLATCADQWEWIDSACRIIDETTQPPRAWAPCRTEIRNSDNVSMWHMCTEYVTRQPRQSIAV